MKKFSLPALVASWLARSAFAMPFRQPAVPLAVSTPFFSIWSFQANDLATPATFWHGEQHTLDSYIRVDGTAYVLLGQVGPGMQAAAQQGFADVFATTSAYNLTAGGVSVQMQFTTPHLPDDFDVAAFPGTYITWSVSSLDGKSHAVQLYLDAGAEPVAGAFPNESVEWDRPAVPGVLALRLGQVGQKAGTFNYTAALSRSTEPHQSQDYGWVYLMAAQDSRLSSQIGAPSAVQAAFAQSGTLPGPSSDSTPPLAVPSSGATPVVAALAWDLGTIPATGPAATATAMLVVDEVLSILVHGRPLAPYWRRDYPVGSGGVVPAAPLAKAVTGAASILQAAHALDASLRTSLLAAGGEHYAAVAELVYRQVFGANGYAWNGSAVWGFQKEISSDGDLSTLDVIFPSAPLPLFFGNATLLAALLEPEFFEMAGFDPSLRYTQPCALHSLGKWPSVEAGNGGCSMPMESTGDALLLAAAVTQARHGDVSWLQPYMPILRNFAGFCASSLPFPAPQDMTDDFSHAPGNLTNLALKCILAIGAQGYIEQAAGNSTGAQALYSVAQSFGSGFASMAWVTDSHGQAPHFKFIYNNTWDDSYGLMYNAVWARFLGLEWLIPGFYPLFTAHYAFVATQTANATWCFPLSSMEKDSKWDWLSNTAALMYTNGSTPTPSQYSSTVIDQLFFFANTTGSRFPITDHPECTGSFPPQAAADRARPVMGGVWASMLAAQPPAGFVKARKDIAAFASAHMRVDVHAEAHSLRGE